MALSEYFESIKNKSAAVIGFGISNKPLAELLLNAGIKTTIRDLDPKGKIADIAPDYEKRGAAFILGPGYLENLTEDIIFRSPGVMPHTPEIAAAVKRGAELTSEMELFFRLAPCKIIAVTGSDGKTTTTTLISELLKAAGHTVYLGGNIGTPLLDIVDGIKANDYAVVELSSFQLMTMTRAADIAVITNITPNHLDKHKDYEEYISAKKQVFLHQKPGSRVVLNYDNEITRSFADAASGSVVFFSRLREVENGVYVKDETIYSGGRPILKTADIKIPGVHNVENWCAAIAAVGDIVQADIIREVAKDFGGVEHRIEFVREIRGAKYYNDSIASSPNRTIAGLRSFNQRIILIAGGKDKKLNYEPIGAEIIRHVKELVLTGETAQKIEDSVKSRAEYQGLPPIYRLDTFESAVNTAVSLARSGDIVVLSPASTSFDRFENFEERGNYFKKLINEIDISN